MRAPAFWARDGVAPALLAPLAVVYAAATARRVARPGWRAPVPVICCGNAGVGGAGKTTLALDLGQRLLARGMTIAFLTRGYGGRLAGARVDPRRHAARDVGDEAMLLAAVAPTYVAPDRAVSARMAVADGAGALVMDDGLQNPTLEKTLSLLVIDGAAGFGNGRVLPAGPLREPIGAAAGRCAAAVLIGEDATGALRHLSSDPPVLRAMLQPADDIAALVGRRVLAFAGIGRPEKFFAMLEQAGVVLAGQAGFPDHHPYTGADLAGLRADADRLGAILVTTPKDAARLRPDIGVTAVGVRLAWRDEAALSALLDRVA
jgi:tetraacyldisaccharide 4'-kinase